MKQETKTWAIALTFTCGAALIWLINISIWMGGSEPKKRREVVSEDSLSHRTEEVETTSVHTSDVKSSEPKVVQNTLSPQECAKVMDDFYSGKIVAETLQKVNTCLPTLSPKEQETYRVIQNINCDTYAYEFGKRTPAPFLSSKDLFLSEKFSKETLDYKKYQKCKSFVSKDVVTFTSITKAFAEAAFEYHKCGLEQDQLLCEQQALILLQIKYNEFENKNEYLQTMIKVWLSKGAPSF